MKTKTKSVIVLLFVFILGAVIGILADRTVVEHQMRQRFARAGDPGFMKHIMYRIIQPTEEQREKIDVVMDKYAERLMKIRFAMRTETTTLLDSLKNDIDPILMDEQKQRLEEHKKNMMRSGKRDFPFPPGEHNPRDRFNPRNRPPAPDRFDPHDSLNWRNTPPDVPPPQPGDRP